MLMTTAVSLRHQDPLHLMTILEASRTAFLGSLAVSGSRLLRCAVRSVEGHWSKLKEAFETEPILIFLLASNSSVVLTWRQSLF